MKGLRQERNWSQEQLAELSGLSLRTIQRIEASNTAGSDSLVALAAAFDIEVVALERELAMDKSSSEWKKRPAWVRGLFFGSGRIQMDKREHKKMEVIALISRVGDQHGVWPWVELNANKNATISLQQASKS